ncbi:hypothetical protein SCHPADRAFT_955046 [Schizopora paradoxa]|uniref:Uncharacterized protein n=1 Tax=Schizopora paradoxa TaxID=27342 RepID=A0A0H2SN15_9AGAM|nr:hypothetical protein SCHPADRAFT_955046 [Schizopora paradoxa]
MILRRRQRTRYTMDDSEARASANTRIAYRETLRVDDAPDTHFMSSSVLEEFQRDDITYSYASTWSSNFTMSNLVGPGRILGKWYSKAGIGSYAKLVKGALDRMFQSENPKKHEKACEIMLTCAKSDDITVQLEAFVCIVWIFVLFPSKARSQFRKLFEGRNEISDVTVFSWKRPSVEYDIGWLYFYKLASRCLSTHQSSFLDVTAQFDDVKAQSLDFSHFEGLLLSCDDTAGFLFAPVFIFWYWDRRVNSLQDYLQRKGFDDLAIANFVSSFTTGCELRFIRPTIWVWISPPFIYGMMCSLRNAGTDELDELLECDSRLAVWVGIFKLHHIQYPLVYKSWRELCHESIPGPEHAKLRQKMRRLKNVYGPAMQKNFPPEEGSKIDREEKSRAKSVSTSATVNTANSGA